MSCSRTLKYNDLDYDTKGGKMPPFQFIYKPIYIDAVQRFVQYEAFNMSLCSDMCGAK